MMNFRMIYIEYYSLMPIKNEIFLFNSMKELNY